MADPVTPAADTPAVGAAPAATDLTGSTPAAEGGGTSPEGGQGAPQGEGQGAADEAPQGGAPAESETPKAGEGEAAPGAPPEGYAAFDLPEGVELAGAMLEGVTNLAKAHNLNQAQAQALVDLGVAQASEIAERFTSQVKEQPVALPAHWAGQWSEQTTADPELGGENLKATMALTTRVFQTFATPELGKFLNDTGLAHHPELIRFMHKVGKAVSEDTLVVPQGGNGKPTGKGAAKTLYPGMN